MSAGYGGATIDISELARQDRVSGRVYREERIFDLEMERIFYRSWVFVAHESEIPGPDDYKTTLIGRQPVIVNRNRSGGFNVMYNRCRHRGIAICDQRKGKATKFQCPYHGWMYDQDGTLTTVPLRNRYDASFALDELSLIRLPKVESYKGFIFASVTDAVPPLQTHLGNARPYIDEFTHRNGSRGIRVAPAIYKSDLEANWKLQVENSIDFYHVGFVHRIFGTMMNQRETPFMAGRLAGHKNRALGNGHGSLYTDPAFKPDPGPSGSYEPDFNLLVFPNLVLVDLAIRVILPLAVGKTRVESMPTIELDASPEHVAAAMRAHEDFYGPAGFGSPDDMEVVMRRGPMGLAASHEGDWIFFARGLGRETPGPDGIIEGHVTDETAHREFYRRWAEMMRS